MIRSEPELELCHQLYHEQCKNYRYYHIDDLIDNMESEMMELQDVVLFFDNTPDERNKMIERVRNVIEIAVCMLHEAENYETEDDSNSINTTL